MDMQIILNFKGAVNCKGKGDDRSWQVITEISQYGTITIAMAYIFLKASNEAIDLSYDTIHHTSFV